MNDWVAIAIIFIAGMASAILLLGAGSVFRIIWPIVVDDGIGEIRFIDESYGRPELPAAAERWVAQSGIQQDGPDGVICDGMRYKWDADAWHFIGADWVNAPPWATVLLRNENTPGLVWPTAPSRVVASSGSDVKHRRW